MKLIIGFALLIGAPALAFTDFACLNDCLNTGTMYGLCQRRCTVADSFPAPTQVDFACVNRCTAQGYNLFLCRERCAY